MGQKANPIGNRLGIIRGWESNWYGNKKDYATKLVEDHKIRTYLIARINKGGIARIVIERTLGKLIITIHTSKPGIIIGKGGGEVDRIKEELKKLTHKDDVQINILEIRRPELDATIGVVSNSDHNLETAGKAGRNRWKGVRPRVRGVAMNPVDHPMGGGEGRASGGHPRSRNGKYAKGEKTRTRGKGSDKLIIQRRDGKKLTK